MSLAPSASVESDELRRIRSSGLRVRGTNLCKEHKFDEGVEELTEAYRVFPEPLILREIGDCEYARGDARRATKFYKRYLNERPDAEDREMVEQQLKWLRPFVHDPLL